MSYPTGISLKVWNRATLFMFEFAEELYFQPGGSIDSLSWFIERSPGMTQTDYNNFRRIIDQLVLLSRQNHSICPATSALAL